jgi:hypothetical protein
MPIDIGGYALSNISGDLAFGTSGTRLRPANYGIKDPVLPGMLGSCTDGSGTYKVYPFPVNDVNLNIGSPWSVASALFTAPVDALYYTSFGGIVGNGTGPSPSIYGYYAIIVNGSVYNFSYHNTGNIWELHHLEVALWMDAGDWLRWAMNISPAPDSGTASGAYRTNHNTCTVWMIG